MATGSKYSPFFYPLNYTFKYPMINHDPLSLFIYYYSIIISWSMHTAICVGLRLTDLMRVMNALIIKKSYMMKRVLIYCMKNLTKMAKLGNLFFLSPIHNAY